MADQLEFKKMRFELARQKAPENPWKCEHCLRTYDREAQINDEESFEEISEQAQNFISSLLKKDTR